MTALLVFCGGAVAFGQQAWPISAEAQASAIHFSEIYQLDVEQAERLAQIEARLERHLSNISGLREAEPEKYLQKLRAAYLGREHAIRAALKPEQSRMYRKDMIWMRKKRAEKRIDMVKEGQSLLEAEEAAYALPWESGPQD